MLEMRMGMGSLRSTQITFNFCLNYINYLSKKTSLKRNAKKYLQPALPYALKRFTHACLN
jgi:hypothetical protein